MITQNTETTQRSTGETVPEPGEQTITVKQRGTCEEMITSQELDVKVTVEDPSLDSEEEQIKIKDTMSPPLFTQT